MRNMTELAIYISCLCSTRFGLSSSKSTTITLQLVAGVDMKTVSARAGHSKASTTSDFHSHFLKNSDIHVSDITNKIFE